MENLKAVILAAGEGKRMKSNIPKVLHKVMGRPMVMRVIDAARKAGAESIAVVAGHGSEQVIEAVSGEEPDVKFYLQESRQGTGHAVKQAVDFIGDENDVLILYGDTPLIKAETLADLYDFHKKEGNGASIISAHVENSAGYGRIIRDRNGNFVKNVEDKDAVGDERNVNEINTGVYCFNGKRLKEALSLIKNDNAQKEYYLPDTLAVILEKGYGVNAMETDDVSEFMGVNSRVQLSKVEAALKNRINVFHMENGVTITDPSQTYIGDFVKIGRDTIIHPGTILEGSTEIGENCEIGPYSRLTNMVVGNGTSVQFSTALDSYVGNGTKVGPYAYIRPNSKIGDNIKVGDFVEVKNSVIGDGTKISHLTYVGDSDVGKNINFGCGTVTVNYDGKKKFRTVIEDNVFIGCNANLVAPVTLKEGSYVAAGSTVTKDVPEGSLAVARPRQQNIEGWTKK